RRASASTLFPYTTLFRSTIMGIAVVALLSALSTSVRNATRLTDYDRAVLLARAKMDSLLADRELPRETVLEQALDPALLGGARGDRKSTRLNSSHDQISY